MSKKKDLEDYINEIEQREEVDTSGGVESLKFDDVRGRYCPKCGRTDYEFIKRNNDLTIIGCSKCPNYYDHH